MTESQVPARFSDPAQFVLHPTDFSPESEMAFAHALRVALTNRAHLALLHIGDSDDAEWDRFPAVRATLHRWGVLESGARREDIGKLGLVIEKLIAKSSSDIAESIAGYLVDHPVDLLVLATHGRRRLAAWLHPSIAEQTARRTLVPTLFVPAASRGCVSLSDGRVTMERVLIPVDHQPPSEAAIERGLRAMQAYGEANSELVLLHVGSESDFPKVDIPQGPWNVERIVRQGNPVTEILAAAEDHRANLLIMVTEGSHGFLDVLRGTTTEQVLRQTPCPVLSVPASF